MPLDSLKLLHQISPIEIALGWWAEQNQNELFPDTPEVALFRSWLNIPEDLHSLKIWYYAKELYSIPIELLAWWLVTSQTQITTTEWAANAEHITLTIEGSGNFNKVRQIETENGSPDFWLLDIKSETLNLPLESLAATLLIIQLAALQGGGTLVLHKFDGQQVEIRLNIPKAQASSVLPKGWLSDSDPIREQITDHILMLIALSFKDVCQQLKLVLFEEELPRLELSVGEEETSEDYKLSLSFLRDTVSKLDEILQALEDWLKENKAT